MRRGPIVGGDGGRGRKGIVRNVEEVLMGFVMDVPAEA